MPSHARVVVVGGGIIGNSVAYHLGKMGMSDVVLLEQSQLTSGTTWHAAGLVGTFGSLSETATELRKYTKQLYQDLEAETGQSTGFKPCGFIELAANNDRREMYRRVAAFNRRCGVEVNEISPKEIKELFPLCKTDDLLCGFHVPTDGRANPVDASMAMAKGARMNGVRIYENTRVSNIITNEAISNKKGFYDNRKQVTGVEVTSDNGDKHTIQADIIVNCTGMWARQFGEVNDKSINSNSSNVIIPNQAAEHYYLITDAMKNVDPNWPIIEDPENYTYIRPEAGGLMVGLFEGKAASWNVNHIPNNFTFGEIEPDWERMAPYVEAAMNRVPETFNVGVKKFFCGPESFTPDLSPCFGQVPEIDNYYVAAGMNSIGILSGGGIGRSLASWIINNKPDVDVTGMNVDRFHKYQTNPLYREKRVEESLGLVYKTHYPFKGSQSCRGAKYTPLYERHQKQGAFFREISGWEIPDWYLKSACNDDNNNNDNNIDEMALKAKEMGDNHSWGKPDWFTHWAAEHKACREKLMLLDMSFMSKFLVQGNDAGKALNYLCTSNVDGDINTITYTQMLNNDGKLEADVTVMKLNENKFIIIATDTMHRHVESHLQRYLDPNSDKNVIVNDVTGAYAQLNIQGPLSRDLMRALAKRSRMYTGSGENENENDDPYSEENFPFRHAKEIPIGFARVRCARITYVGELGYELHIPVEQALHVYNEIIDICNDKEESEFHGKFNGMLHGGLKALASLRLEKGYRDYGHDMDNTDTLIEMGLTFTCDFDKLNGFMGKDAVLKQKNNEQLKLKGLKRRLVNCFVPIAHDDPINTNNPEHWVMLYHAEPIFRDGICVGDVRVGSYGHTLGGPIGLAHISPKQPEDGKGEFIVVNKKYITTGKWEVEINGVMRPLQLSLQPFYDPKNEKIKAIE